MRYYTSLLSLKDQYIQSLEEKLIKKDSKIASLLRRNPLTVAQSKLPEYWKCEGNNFSAGNHSYSISNSDNSKLQIIN